MEPALQFMNNSSEFAMEYYKDDDLFLAMDQESVEKYAIDKSMGRMELQNPPILDSSDGTGTTEGQIIWGSTSDNLSPLPSSEELFEFPFIACNAQIAQEQDLLNFQLQDMELSFISKPKMNTNTVIPMIMEYTDAVDSDSTDSTEFTLLGKSYSGLSNDVLFEDSASHILSQLNNQAIANDFNSTMNYMRKNLEEEKKLEKIEKEKLLEAIKLKRIQKENLLEERRLKKIQKEKLEEERKLKKLQKDPLLKDVNDVMEHLEKGPNNTSSGIVKPNNIPFEKPIRIKKFGIEEKDKKTKTLLANKSYSGIPIQKPIHIKKFGIEEKDKKTKTPLINKSYSEIPIHKPTHLKEFGVEEKDKKTMILPVNKSYSDIPNYSSLEDSTSYILSQLKSPIPMKYIRKNEEKDMIDIPSEKGYGVEKFEKEIGRAQNDKESKVGKIGGRGFEVEEYEKVRGIGYGVEEFEKRKKEINRIQIKTKGNIGKFGTGEKEYFDLPYGWTKEVVYLKNQPSMRGKIRQDIYLISPGRKGKKLQSDAKLQRFLQENPDIECDLSVTSTKATVHREFLKNCSFDSKESGFSRKINVEIT